MNALKRIQVTKLSSWRTERVTEIFFKKQTNRKTGMLSLHMNVFVTMKKSALQEQLLCTPDDCNPSVSHNPHNWPLTKTTNKKNTAGIQNVMHA